MTFFLIFIIVTTFILLVMNILASEKIRKQRELPPLKWEIRTIRDAIELIAQAESGRRIDWGEYGERKK